MPLGFTVRLDVRSIQPNKDAKLNLVVVIEATGEPKDAQEPRAPSRTILALDVSGSMSGEPLEHVVRSVDRLLDTFAADDEVGVVAFSDQATSVVEPVKVDVAGKRLVRARVARLHANGNTNVEAGLELGAELLKDVKDGMRRGVVLLSDGVPNRGAYTAETLREAVKRHRPSCSFFALGYGKDHNEDILSAVGDAGGGGYEFVADPSTCIRAFARALGAQADVVASRVELVIAPADGVEVVRFVGKEEMRFSKEGVVVALPDMVLGARSVVVAELVVKAPSVEKLLARLGDITLRAYKTDAKKEDLTVEIADREPAVDGDALRDIFLVRADRVREEARAQADRGNFAGAASAIRAFLAEIFVLPGFVANDGSPLAEAYELLVDEAMAFARVPSAEEYGRFRKQAVASKLGTSAPEGARMRGSASTRFIEQTAGDLPEAVLVIDGGARHRLREECVIGRTESADIVLSRDGVSRRHASIYAIDGKFLIADLGSTNTTAVNGQALRLEPHVLQHDDVIVIGGHSLRYEIVKK